MPIYQYMARAGDGRIVNGTAEAADQATVVRMLREKGLVTTQIRTGAPSRARKKAKRLKGGGVRLDDLVVYSQQMAVMIRAGLPLIEVLDILAEQTERKRLADIVRKVERDVEGGSSLTEAMQKYPKTFSMFFISMVRAGEAAGMLDTILDQVATYLERIASLHRKIRSATMYPATVSLVACAITIFLLVKVVPVFQQIFEDLQGTLPLPTRMTVAASKFMQHQWYVVLFAALGIWIFLWQFAKTKTGRYKIDQLKLKLPVFGQLFLKSSIAKFARTLATLIRSGVNILYALEIVAKTVGNAVIEQAVLKTRISIQSGESITRPLVESGIFPPMVTRMVDVGERTGALESMLTKIADFYEDQVNTLVNGLTSLIEPLLIVFLGCLVGFIVISMFLPMFAMIETLSH